jgi:hypothetical protein
MATAMLTVACKDEESIEITSLSKGGSTFYFGEKVPVWTCLNQNPGNVTYDWDCTGGFFDGIFTQHLYENLWVAPREAGEYTVQVTANAGNQSETRQTKMKVTNFYLDTFENVNAQNSAGWTLSGATVEWGNGAMIVKSQYNDRDASVFREFPVSDDLEPPLSIQIKMNYSGYRTVTGNANSASNGGTYIRLAFTQPAANPDKPFVQYLSWIVCPVTPGSNSYLDIRQNTPQTGASSAISSVGTKNSFMTFPANETHTFTITLDSDLLITTSFDGQTVVNRSDIIAKFVSDNAVEQSFNVRELRILVPRKSSASAELGETTWNVTQVQINDKRTAIGGDVNNIGFEQLP